MRHLAWVLAGVAFMGCDKKDDASSDASKTEAAKTEPDADAAKDSSKAPDGEAAKDPEPTAAAGEGPAKLRIVGHVEIPGQGKLEFTASIDKGDAGYAGTIDIPMQGAEDLPLSKVTVGADAFEFSIANGATWRGKLDESGTVTECAFEQGPAKLSCEMKAVDDEGLAAAGPKRPQTPQAPFPYDAQDVTWEAGEGVTLAGTIVKPKGAGPHPAVVFISGSGQQDRNESLMGHKPFLLLADRLARAGVASLRYDDRMIGGSKGDVERFTMEDEAEDAASALTKLAETEGIDAKRIGIIGHSSGGVIAPMVAAKRADDVAFVVLLAGTGVPGSKILEGQRKALMKAQGVTDEQAAAAEEHNKKIEAVVDSGKSDEEVATEVKAMLAEAGVTGPAAEAQISALTSPWFRHFRTYDPAPTLEKLRCPVLIANGELDLQVLADDNVPAIEAALKKGGNGSVTTKRFAGLNHLFQPAKTGSVEEYAQIETTFDEDALKTILDWVQEQTAG